MSRSEDSKAFEMLENEVRNAKKMAVDATKIANDAMKQAGETLQKIEGHEELCSTRWESVKGNTKAIQDFQKYIMLVLIGIVGFLIKIEFY
jgi:hypothetical protein